MMLKSFSVSTCSRLVVERAPFHPLRDFEAGGFEHGRRKIDRADGLGRDGPGSTPGPRRMSGTRRQRVVAERALEDHLVLAEELAVIARDDHERVVGEPALVEHVEHPTDRVIELRDHAVVAGGHLGQLFTREERTTRVCPVERSAAHALRHELVDRRLALELVGVDFGQHFEHVGGRVAIAPRRGRVHRMVRIGEAHPTEERTVDGAQPLARDRRPTSSGDPPPARRCATFGCGPTPRRRLRAA